MQSTMHLLLLTLISVAWAQLPSTPSGLTIVNSKVDSKVTISFKQTEICKQASGAKSYSGYVHLPGSVLSDIGGYDINTYFIYFEARHNASTAPLSIYLAGGPGESSTYAALSSESGPCYVNINGTDTTENPWSFNDHVNMLYIDQPVQAGFSYDTLVSAIFDLSISGGLITPTNISQASLPTVNSSIGYGTFPSQNFANTANTTVLAAKSLWHFAEHWLSSFPGYATKSNKISLFGNSYGGYWVPSTAAQFSKKLSSLPSKHPLKCKKLKVDAIGITNGCVDIATGVMGYLEYAYNNTYGVQFGSEEEYDFAYNNLTMPGGCQDLIQQCRALGQLSDPDSTGSNTTVNELCMQAFYSCELNVILPFPFANERDAFDIAIPLPAPCDVYLPVLRYLNNATTQQALGVPLNFTQNSNIVEANFGLPGPYLGNPLAASTGDPVRYNGLTDIEYLLAKGVKIAFIFGDRDYRCPWTSGEATALAAKWTHQSDFASAGYQLMQGITTPADQGGHGAVVKQYGQFSFSRVFDSGHMVSAYAPETVYRIFERTIAGLDVVSGSQAIKNGYHTTGPVNSLGWRNILPNNLPKTCMVEGQFTSTNPWTGVLPPGS